MSRTIHSVTTILRFRFDLSDVLFVTTANDLGTVPRPLLDRMEVIELSSYTAEEKLHIAANHLLPKQRKKHGLSQSALHVSDDALKALISGYTREAGVRRLEQQLAKLCRKAAKKDSRWRGKVGHHLSGRFGALFWALQSSKRT